MKIFVVTDGCYSDYHICAIFSTMEKAQAFTAGLDSPKYHADVEIVEWDVDADNGEVFKKQYWVEINLSSGDIAVAREYVEKVKKGLRGTSGVYSSEKGYGKSYISLEHAQKLAVERRQQWLRDGQRSIVEEMEELTA